MSPMTNNLLALALAAGLVAGTATAAQAAPAPERKAVAVKIIGGRYTYATDTDGGQRPTFKLKVTLDTGRTRFFAPCEQTSPTRCWTYAPLGSDLDRGLYVDFGGRAGWVRLPSNGGNVVQFDHR